jgi:hypothetical protein
MEDKRCCGSGTCIINAKVFAGVDNNGMVIKWSQFMQRRVMPKRMNRNTPPFLLKINSD